MYQYPYLRLIIPFITGILLALFIESALSNLLIIICAFFILYALSLFFYFDRLDYHYRWIPGVFINLLLLFAGYELTIINTPGFSTDNISNYNTKKEQFIVQLAEPVTERQNSFKTVAKIIKINDSSGWIKKTGKILLYFEKGSKVSYPNYGDKIVFDAQLNDIKPPQNPGEFNYKRYLSNKGIYNQTYIQSGNWKILDRNKGSFVVSMGFNLRKKFLEILQSQGIEGREFAVVSAILLGYDHYLDSDQVREFSGAGAMHILCVSGLHVGIIYVILNSLLLFMDKRKYLKIGKTFLLLLLIWVYGLITGLSPSVMRACTMFSFIIMGQLAGRRSNIYNSIFASAFVLLIINPYILTEVGFQLSYLAVLGIVTVYKPIYNLHIPKWWLVRNIWQITAVSLSATLATFPLSLYYFHQFPNLFLITNLIAIPISMLIIYAGILVLVTSFIPMVSNIVAYVLTKIVWLLNISVQAIEGLPYATSKGIYINTLELIIVFSILLCVVIMFLQNKRKYLFYMICLLIALASSFSFRHLSNINQKKIIVYSVGKSSALAFIDGKSDILLMDSALLNDGNKIGYHINNNRVISRINRQNNLEINAFEFEGKNFFKQKNFVQFQEKRIMLVNSSWQLYGSHKKVKVDYLIVSDNPKLKISNLSRSINYDQIIFDSSNSWWNTKRWVEECNELNIKYYDVSQQGALEINI